MIHDYLYLWWKTKLGEVAELKNVEMDFGQDIDGQAENQLITTPAELISFPGETEMFDLGNGIQECEMFVTLRLVTFNYRWKDDRIRKAGKVNHFDVARNTFQHVNKIRRGLLSEIAEFAALAGTDADQAFVNGITRSGVSINQEHSVYIRSSQTFKMRVVDFTGNLEFQNAVASLEITNLDIMP